MRRSGLLRFIVGLSLALPPQTAELHAQQPSAVRELDEAKALYREARLFECITRLDAAIEKLRVLPPSDRRRLDLVDAHLFLGLSKLALNEREGAKAALVEVVRLDPERRLDPEVYAQKVVELFEEARAEVRAEPTAQAAPSPSPTGTGSGEKKGRSKLPLVILGGAAVVGGGAALTGGGKNPSATATTLPSLTATVSSSQDGAIVNCRTPVTARVTLTNNSGVAVSVTGLRRAETRTPVTCGHFPDQDYRPLSPAVGAGQTVVVFDGSLRSFSGSGCCSTGTACSGVCEYLQEFFVLTGSGEFSAGSIRYVVQFANCETCPSAAGVTGLAPAGSVRGCAGISGRHLSKHMTVGMTAGSANVYLTGTADSPDFPTREPSSSPISRQRKGGY